MARRRRDDQLLELSLQAAAIFGLLVLFRPGFRHFFESILSFVLLAVILLAVAAACAFAIHTIIKRRRAESDQDLGTGDLEQPASAMELRLAAVKSEPVSLPNSLSPDRLRRIDWFQFEKLVSLVYRKLGYVVTRRGGANADGGIDLVLEKDGEHISVQCKHWKMWKVGVKAMREFVGALTDANLKEGIFVTLGEFTSDASELADRHGISLVSETSLIALFEQTDARFDPETAEILDDERKFCPRCESEMMLRTATKGRGTGQQFWGCSAYPKCRFTFPAD